MSAQTSVFNSSEPYYEIMIDWEKRLAHESPFFQRALQSVHAHSVLDCACGLGQHACLFARWGMSVSGSDLSEEMVRKARHLADSRGLAIEFKQASYDALSQAFAESFDAVVCTGNSLSLAGKRSVVETAIREMGKVTRQQGVLILHVLNYDLFPPGKNTYGEPVAREHIGQNYIFLKNFCRAGTTCDMDLIVLQSGATDTWTRTVFSERLLLLDKASLVGMVEAAGFGKIKLYGGYGMAPFDAKTSHDLILVARKE
ncbi:MAG: class I SAM-dependent methyltransferase [Planctomycetes bacterium]|nr:class I SAM-dependent methyltransferase [Planctomycetota bacterium]